MPPTRPQPLNGIAEYLAGAPVLRPEVLDPLTEDAARALYREGESSNTVASYQTALRYWGAWYQLRYGRPIALPLPEAVVVQFIVDHVEVRMEDGRAPVFMPEALDKALVELGVKARRGPPALSTIVHRISVLSKMHSIRSEPNPCSTPAVRELLSRVKKAFARRGVRQDRKDALTADRLRLVLDTCDDSLIGVRDRALLHFAWSSGGRRRSEVTQASFDNVKRLGPGRFMFVLGTSKNNQSGELRAEDHKPVIGDAGIALQAWLEASGLQYGAIFRRIRKGGAIGEPLSDAAVRDIVKRRCEMAGLGGNFSAHSIRSGFVTEAGRQQAPVGDAMALTGHHNVSTFMRYYRASELMGSAAANLFATSAGRDEDADREDIVFRDR